MPKVAKDGAEGGGGEGGKNGNANIQASLLWSELWNFHLVSHSEVEDFGLTDSLTVISSGSVAASVALSGLKVSLGWHRVGEGIIKIPSQVKSSIWSFQIKRGRGEGHGLSGWWTWKIIPRGRSRRDNGVQLVLRGREVIKCYSLGRIIIIIILEFSFTEASELLLLFDFPLRQIKWTIEEVSI